MVALFQLGGLLVADAEDHLAALAVHLPVRVGPFEVARQQLGALLDLLGLFEGVVRLDVAEVQRLGVVRPVGVDRGDLPLFSISVTSSMSVNFATVYRSDAPLIPRRR